MTELAVIGIDAEFAGLGCIDRVERAFYQGAFKSGARQFSLNFGDEVSGLATDLSQICLSSIERQAQSNKLCASDIAAILVIEHLKPAIQAELTAQLTQDLASVDIVDNLHQALQYLSGATANTAVALIGLNLVATLSESQLTDVRQVATLSFDQSFGGYREAQGIASLLISSTTFAAANNSYIYSTIKGFAGNRDIATAAQTALVNASVVASEVELLEVSALDEPALNERETNGLLAAYNDNDKLHTAISCARSVTGEGAGFSQIAGLLKCVISLQQRYIPAINDWQQPHDNALTLWQDSSFYFPVDVRPWFPRSDGGAHTAAYSCLTTDSYCHVILQENLLLVPGCAHPLADVRSNGYFAASELSIILIAGDNEAQLHSELQRAEQSSNTASLKQLANDGFERFKRNKSRRFAAVLIAESNDELLKEIRLARSGISQALATGTEWKTPKGSYFSAALATDGKPNSLAFLYPGIGATYVGLGRDLFHLFPQIYQPVAQLADDIGASLKDRLLNPRSVIRHGFKDLKRLDLELRGNLANIAEAGVGFACVFTKVFEQVFEVKADFATGYSMGEVSMYAALGCWQQPGLMSARLANSDTFNHRLCGELQTLRTHWQLPDVADGTFEKIWETYTIKATIEQVELAAADEDRVYCTIVNTPDNLLLGGYPQACERVVKKLGVRAMPLNMANAIHSAPAYAEFDHMIALYTMDVTERIGTKMYSSSCYLPIPQRSKAIAHSIAKCLCDVVDFPRLVNTLHDKGARVFVEMGPGRSLCSWVDKILEHRAQTDQAEPLESHVAVPVNAKGTSDELTYVRAIAKLVSHGVELNLNSLFEGSIIQQVK